MTARRNARVLAAPCDARMRASAAQVAELFSAELSTAAADDGVVDRAELQAVLDRNTGAAEAAASRERKACQRASRHARVSKRERARKSRTHEPTRAHIRAHARTFAVMVSVRQRTRVGLARQLAFKDVDGDGDVDADDVLAMFDKDGDGKLDAAEIAVLLRFGPLPPTPAPGLRDPSTMGSELVPRIHIVHGAFASGTHLVLTGTGGGNQGDE